MKNFLFSQKPKLNPKENIFKNNKRIEFVDFVAGQLKNLSKKNLRIPVQLYNL